jgi:hypothetical protein
MNEDLLARYPRLIAVMKWVALLSTSEALNALVAYKAGNEWTCEAVDHFGGATAVVQHAVAKRHSYYGLR